MNKEIKFDIPNYAIPDEIKEICRECEHNIHCQNKGCAFRSLGNEYCDRILNATLVYLKLQQENQQLKEQLEKSEKARVKCLNKIKTLGKFDGENFTRNFTLWSADFNELAKILDIDKGE